MSPTAASDDGLHHAEGVQLEQPVKEATVGRVGDLDVLRAARRGAGRRRRLHGEATLARQHAAVVEGCRRPWSHRGGDTTLDLFERTAHQPERGAPEETLEGVVERIVFSGGDGAFTVARLQLEGRPGAVVTVVGSLLGVPAGTALRVQGRYETTARFGEQFRASRATPRSRPRRSTASAATSARASSKESAPSSRGASSRASASRRSRSSTATLAASARCPASARRARSPSATPGAPSARCAR